MDSSAQDEPREVRIARYQSLFREVNEKLKKINEAFEVVIGTHAITCECADLECIAPLQITGEEYAVVRANPRRFVVLRDHVHPEAENVVEEEDGYVVVEKFGIAGETAERIYATG